MLNWRCRRPSKISRLGVRLSFALTVLDLARTDGKTHQKDIDLISLPIGRVSFVRHFLAILNLEYLNVDCIYVR